MLQNWPRYTVECVKSIVYGMTENVLRAAQNFFEGNEAYLKVGREDGSGLM